MLGMWVILLCAGSGVLLLPQILHILRRPGFPGRSTAAGFLCSLAIWCIAYAGELEADDPATMLMWLRVQYLGLAYLPAWLFLFSLSFNGLDAYMTRRVVLFCFAIGSVTLLLVWSYPHQTLFYSELLPRTHGVISFLKVRPGAWYWMHTGVFYATVMLFWASMCRNLWKKGRIYRSQFVWFFVASVVPIVGNVLYLMGRIPPTGFDPTCLLLTYFALVLMLGTKRSRLFDLVPFARDRLMDQLRDGFLVTDHECRLLDVNPAAVTLLGIRRDQIGTPVKALLPEGLLENDWNRHPRVQLSVSLEEGGRWREFRCVPLQYGKNVAGYLLMVRDIHHEKELEIEREALVEELQEAMANIKQLKGLIPICASCKKIRDDNGYWNKLEHYLQQHSGATFSHGFCPECLEQHYNLSSEDPGSPSA
jgi:hypothetical protein